MNKADLIDDLVEDLRPERTFDETRAIIVWFVASAFFALFFLWIVGLRPDLSDKFKEMAFSSGLAMMVAFFLITSWISVADAVPGKAVRRIRTIGIGVAITGLTSILLYSGLFEHRHTPIQVPAMEALMCCVRISFGAMLPNLTLALIISRMAPMRMTRTAAFGGAASVALIAIVSQLNCPIDDVMHVILGHGVFLMIATTILYFAYKALFRLTAQRVLEKRLGTKSSMLKSRIG